MLDHEYKIVEKYIKKYIKEHNLQKSYLLPSENKLAAIENKVAK